MKNLPVLRNTVVAALFTTLAAYCQAEECKNLPTVTDLLRADQTDLQLPLERWNEIKANRKIRQIQLETLVACNAVKTANDWHRAGIVMIHGETEADLIKAMEYTHRALAIDPYTVGAKQMLANEWDKLMLMQGKKQWYGTQYKNNAVLPIQPCVISNQTRREYGIAPEVIATQPESCADQAEKSIALVTH